MSRDPIGERGGWNLYGFVRNDGYNHCDPFGMKSILTDPKGTLDDGKPGFSVKIEHELELGGDYVQFIRIPILIAFCDGETGEYTTFAGDIWKWQDIEDVVSIDGNVARLKDNWTQPGHGEQCYFQALWISELVKTSTEGADRFAAYITKSGYPPDPISGMFRIWGDDGNDPYKKRVDLIGNVNGFSVISLAYSYTDTCNGDGMVEESHSLLGDFEEAK